MLSGGPVETETVVDSNSFPLVMSRPLISRPISPEVGFPVEIPARDPESVVMEDISNPIS